MAKALIPFDGTDEDVQIKMQLVHNLYAGCIKELNISQENDTFKVSVKKPRERFHQYLCLRRIISRQMPDLIKKKSKQSNRVVYKRSTTGQTKVEDENYDLRVDLQKFMKELILEQRILPTTYAVLPGIQKLMFVPPHHFRKKIRQEGYTWQKLPNTEFSFIAEKPQHIRERYHYLKKIKQYRAECRYMVYITNKITTEFFWVEDDMKTTTTFLHRSLVLAVSPNDGRKHHVFNCPRGRKDNFQLWVLHILCRLPSNSVLVFEDIMRRENIAPSKENSKTEMMEWMQKNGIPFSPDMHKAELHELIVNFKPTIDSSMNEFDKKLESRGFTVLHKPITLFDVEYYKSFWKDIKRAKTYPFLDDQLNFKKSIELFQDFLGDLDLNYWKNLETELIEAERKFAEDDALIEDMIDKVMTMIDIDGLPKDDFEDVLDEFISSDESDD